MQVIRISKIRYQIPGRSKVTLTVYDILGQKVKTLVDREQTGGSYEIIWNGTDDRQNKMPSGVYLYRLENNQQVLTRKMVLIR